MFTSLTMDVINPCIRKAGIESLETTLGHRRFIYDYEMIYCHSGKLQVLYDHKTIKVSKGHMIILPPGLVHQLDSRMLKEAYWVHFDFVEHFDRSDLANYIEENLPKIGYINKDTSRSDITSNQQHLIRKPIMISPNKKLPDYYEVHNPESTKAIFLSLIHSYTHKETTWFLNCKSLIGQLLVESFEHLEVDLSILRNHITLVQELKNYINQYDYRFVTIKELSNQFHYHPDTLNRIFKKDTATTIGQYIQQKRHDKVKQLLQTTDLTLENIAELIGFTDRSHLIKSFRKIEAMSPKEYKSSYISSLSPSHPLIG